MTDDIINQLKVVKKAGLFLYALDEETRKKVLFNLAHILRKNYHHILDENKKDLRSLAAEDPNYDRLLLSKELVYAIADDVERVASLEQTLGQIITEKWMENGLRIQKIYVPLGSVAVIYESRPNVTIDVFAICFKTGNACILKGGVEAHHSNTFLVSLIKIALQQEGIDRNVVYLLPSERTATSTLLNATGLIDVCIPRGSQSLINFVRENAKIPVIETGAGIVHTYFDSSGNIEKGRLIIDNAKTRRVSVCNALDTLIIHEKCLVQLYQLVELLAAKNVELLTVELSFKALESSYPQTLLHKASPDDFGHEFLSYKMSIKTVSSVKEAVTHIMHYTSGHSEAIIADDETAIAYFLENVDAAVVYVNASTAFTDGGQFGLGAEIGISTQKLHARGPMSTEALMSYKWVVRGNGQIRL